MKYKRTKKHVPRYPNAADPQYYLRILLDAALAVVTGIGAFVTLVFLILL